MEINNKNLENALNSSQPNQNPPQKNSQLQISQEEEIGFHKGALNTLANERVELFKMIQNVESIMQAHMQRLEQLGVRIQNHGQSEQQN